MRQTVEYFENFITKRSSQKRERFASCKFSLCFEYNFLDLTYRSQVECALLRRPKVMIAKQSDCKF